MSFSQRREQLISVGRQLFAEKGFDATSIEEIAARAKVSKPVVYEHFGGKEGLYAVVVDREVTALLDRITNALDRRASPGVAGAGRARAAGLHRAGDRRFPGACARVAGDVGQSGNFSSVLNDVAHQVEHILGAEFKSRGYDPKLAELYSQALVGMVALTGRWWLEVRKPRKETVAAHLVNLAWNGLSHLDAKPALVTRKDEVASPSDAAPRRGGPTGCARGSTTLQVRAAAAVAEDLLLGRPARRCRACRTCRRAPGAVPMMNDTTQVETSKLRKFARSARGISPTSPAIQKTTAARELR